MIFKTFERKSMTVWKCRSSSPRTAYSKILVEKVLRWKRPCSYLGKVSNSKDPISWHRETGLHHSAVMH